MEPAVTDQGISQPPTEPAVAPAEPTTWAQPPAASERAAGWVQPATGAARRLYGSTEARQWQPNPALAACAEPPPKPRIITGLVDATELDVASKIAGRVKAVSVKPGDKVKAGGAPGQERRAWRAGLKPSGRQ